MKVKLYGCPECGSEMVESELKNKEHSGCNYCSHKGDLEIFEVNENDIYEDDIYEDEN